MRAVVADTGPLNYLVLIDLIGILPLLFGMILVPEKVKVELSHPQAPLTVREWLASEPPWLDIRSGMTKPDSDLRSLGDGEQAAITLALESDADLILMDDRRAVVAARRKGLAVTGTLGLLELAARRDLVDLHEAFAKLRQTSFRCRPNLLDEILVKYLAR